MSFNHKQFLRLRDKRLRSDIARLKALIYRQHGFGNEDAFKEGYIRGIDETGNTGWIKRMDIAWNTSSVKRR